MSLRLFSSFINKTQNPCISCINYVNYNYKYPIDKIYDSETKLGSCSIFGKQNLVTGKFEYHDAFECRINALKCGLHGKYYKSKSYNNSD